MNPINPTPTKRAVIDPLRLCQLRCRFCYYAHQDMKSVRNYLEVKKDIDAAAARGNNYIDITGGEPFLYPEIEELISYCHGLGMRVCIITNAMGTEKKTESILNAGLDGLLVSIHGKADTHNYLVQHPEARQAQERFLAQVVGRVHLRFNFVINHFNQLELPEVAQWMATFKPKIVNFINMNPHHEWQNKVKETQGIVADLHKVEPLLNESIEYLESQGVGVNVRYYPMCRIAEKYRRCVCNDLHVVFDPFEWDYGIQPKKYEEFLNWSINASKSIELKSGTCGACTLHAICGGINKAFNTATNASMLTKISEVITNPSDFYYYRRNNTLTLDFS